MVKLDYLCVPLPEDIKKLKYFGDTETLNRVIDLKLKENIAEPLRQRLLLEKHIMSVWMNEYSVSEEEMLRCAQEEIEGFTKEELEELRENDAVEWTYINGKVYYEGSALANLFVTRNEYLRRAKKEERRIHADKMNELRDGMVSYMKKNGGVRARLRMKVTAKAAPDPERKNDKIICQFPLPRVADQIKKVDILSLSHENAVIAPEKFPARTVRLEGSAEKAFEIEYEFEAELPYQDLKAEEVSEKQESFDTQEVLPHIRFSPFIRMMAKKIVGGETNPLLKARKIYDYITTKNIYSYMRNYWTIPNIPEYYLSGRKGDCGVQALTFITLCRCVDIPARWQSGLWACPEDVGSHDWAQFYIAPYGWLFCDPSFGGSAWRNGNTERWDFYFGHLDPYRMPANCEFQAQFYMPMKQIRYDPYDNQSCEMEYEDMPVPRSQIDISRELVSFEMI